MQLLGSLPMLGHKRLHIFATEPHHYGEKYGSIYFAYDPNAFLAAPSSEKGRQQIARILHRTIFTTMRKSVEFYTHTDADRVVADLIRAHLQGKVNDALLELAETCEGADDSDLEKFCSCEGVTVTPIPELSEFPKTVALVTGEFNYGQGRREQKRFLQITTGHGDGYNIEHQEITPEMIAFLKLPNAADLLGE